MDAGYSDSLPAGTNLTTRVYAQIRSDILSGRYSIGEAVTELGLAKELHVSRLMLDKGEVDIDGRIDSVTYSEQGSRTERTESLLGRLFK